MQERKQVLVVSCDRGGIRRALDRIPRGGDVRVVGSYGEALGVLFGEGWGELPVLVLVDTDLPDGSGRDLVRSVRSDPWLRGATTASLLEAPEMAEAQGAAEVGGTLELAV